MRARTPVALAALCLSLLGAACGTNQDTTAERIVRINGSNGVLPLARALGEAYMAATPGARVEFGEGIGSRTRMDSLRAGVMDIALASHGLDTAALRTEGMRVIRFAESPVVVGVHAGSISLAGMSEAQLCDVIAGRTTSWRALGDGRDLPITVVMRPENEVDTEVLRDRVQCAKTLAVSATARVVEETADMARALTETEGAIGVTTSTVVTQSEGAIRALSLNGVRPSPATVRDGQYVLVRSSYLVTRAGANAAVDQFLAFVASDAGRAVLEANGSLAVTR
jgi:phosphate transport system substrate-binding protein